MAKIKESTPSRSTVYRRQLKEKHPEQYKLYLEKQKVANKTRRDAVKKELSKRHPSDLSIEKHKKILENQRKRQKKYLEKKRQQNGGKLPTTKKQYGIKTLTRKSSKEKREYNRKMKALSRSRMTPQKRAWERKKDRERKAKKKNEEKKSQKRDEKEKNVHSKKVSNSRKCAKAILGKILRSKRRSKVNEQEIQSFYIRTDISRVVPHKRYATKKGPGYLMQMSVSAAYLKYVEEKGKIVSFGKFASLRPTFVRKMSTKHREYCVCVYCINIRYKMMALSKHTKQFDKKKQVSEYQLADIVLCKKAGNERYHRKACIDGKCEECADILSTLKLYYTDVSENDVISWSRWEKTVTTDGRIHRHCVTKYGKKEELLEEMLVDIKTPSIGVNFFQHLHTASWQSHAFSSLKDNLPETWTLSVMDFAKNRMVIYQDEIKGVYYSQEAITVHPIVVYYNTKDGVVRDSCVVVSNDLVHDYHAVHHYQKIVENHIKGKIEKIDRRVIFSDGCSCQYKSKGPFADLAQDNHDNQVDRNFFGSEHGKSDCDAETGVINRAVDRGIIGREVVINSADDMYQYCKKKLSLDLPLSKRHFFYVEKGEIQRERPETEIKTIPESRRIHQILNTSDQMTLKSRNLSCFCVSCKEGKTSECVNSDYIENYKIRKLKLVRSASKTEMESSKVEPLVTSATKTEMEPRKVDTPSGCKKRKQEESEEIRPSKARKTEESNPRPPPLYSTATMEQNEGRDIFIEENCKVIENIQNFQELLQHCTLIEKNLEKYPIKENQISIVSGGFTVDPISLDLLDISSSGSTSLPVSVYGDGNCLPRTGSVFAFGDETIFKEMRLRIVVEMCVRKDLYLDSEYLRRESNLDEEEARGLTITYAMFSDKYVAGDVLTSAAIERVYEAEALNAIKSGTYMGIWQIFALSSILKSKIRLLYPPNVGSPLLRLHLNRDIMPFEEKCVTTKTILWTSTKASDAAKGFLNHFVPVLPLTLEVTTDIEDVEEFDDDQMYFDDCTPMEFSSGLDLSQILESLSDSVAEVVDLTEDTEGMSGGTEVDPEDRGQEETEELQCGMVEQRTDNVSDVEGMSGGTEVDHEDGGQKETEELQCGMVEQRTDNVSDVEGMSGGTEVDHEDGGQKETEELQCGMVEQRTDNVSDVEGMSGGTEVDHEDGGQKETEELQCGMVEQRTDNVSHVEGMSGGTEVDHEDGGQKETEELQCGMVEQRTDKFSVGANVLIKHGSEILSAVVVREAEKDEAAKGFWVKFYKGKASKNQWSLEDKLFFALHTDIIKKINAPSLIAVGSRFYYAF